MSEALHTITTPDCYTLSCLCGWQLRIARTARQDWLQKRAAFIAQAIEQHRCDTSNGKETTNGAGTGQVR